MRRLIWIGLAAVGASCDDTARVALQPCRLEGLAEEVLCTRIEVPEDRSHPAGRVLSLRVAVVPASGRNRASDPLFLLAGGPGQAATSMAPWVRTVFERVGRSRDIVLVDQRGTGESNPLDCSSLQDSLDPWPSSLPDSPRRCLEELDADPRFYTSTEAVADLDEVRERLGYDRINLWGGSYGTRTALVYLREHPERARSAVLDGAAPFSLRFPLFTARDSERALDLLIEGCERSFDCSSRFPDLEERLARLFETLERSPIEVELPHPRTGATERPRLTRSSVAFALRGFLYLPAHASLVPWVLSSATDGDWGPFLALYLSVMEWSFETMSLGMTLSVLCTEDVPRMTGEEVREATEGTFLRDSDISFWRGACESWPVEPVEEADVTPVVFDGPVLVLSGGLDPVTPPRWGEELVATLPRGRHFVARGVGHNVTPFGCAPDLVADFLESGSADSLDPSCLDDVSRPPFVTGTFGPEP